MDFLKPTDYISHPYFMDEAPSGTVTLDLAYADNEIDAVTLRIFLDGNDWREIQSEPSYLQLIAYLEHLKNERTPEFRRRHGHSEETPVSYRVGPDPYELALEEAHTQMLARKREETLWKRIKEKLTRYRHT